MPRAVTMIPATIPRLQPIAAPNGKRRRVAAYARVSTDFEEQLTSFETQVSYYTDYIRSHEGWDFVKVYSDEGITGTSIKLRAGFQQMVSDALAGRIDLIITKSISRFARNTVDSLTMIRKLKDNGVEVYFEKENIWTFDSKGELIITIMSSIAQEEARSISENITWGWRSRFADGRFPITNTLGYRYRDGENVIIEDEAKIVRYIFSSYASGDNTETIARYLSKIGAKTIRGNTDWSKSSVRKILCNEKYTGNATLQKTYTVDFLTKKRAVNNGEVPKYYVEDSHPAIISKDMFDYVQSLVHNGRRNQKTPLLNLVICGVCGERYVTIRTHNNTRYEKVYLKCPNRTAKKCLTPHLSIPELEAIVVKALNSIAPDAEKLAIAVRDIVETVYDQSAVKASLSEKEAELLDLGNQIDTIIKQMPRHIEDHEEHVKLYNRLLVKADKVKKDIDATRDSIDRMGQTRGRLLLYAGQLEEMPAVITEYSDKMALLTIQQMTVYSKDRIEVTFKDGRMVTIGL